MFINTRVTIDIATGTVLHREGYEYAGPIADCKQDDTAKDAEKSSAAFTQKLQKAFQTQFASQQGLLNFLNPKMEAMITNPQGYSPEALAAARTNAITQSATDTQNAIKATQAQAAARGGATSLPSGVSQQIAGQINAAGATEKSSALTSIEQQNEDLKQQNRWKGVAALSGDINALDPTAYAGTANQGAGATAGLSNAVTASQSAGFWNHLEDSFGSALGNTLGGGNASGGSGAKGYFGLG